MSKATMALTEQQQTALQMIVSDRDAAEALRFLKEVVWAQVQAARRLGLRGHLEQGNP